MDIPEVLALSAFLLVAGIETTERTLTNLMSILVVRPDLWERLRNERGMVQPAIAEALRVKPPIHGLTRRVTQTFTLHGESVREGSRILALLAAANRDARVFANADEFDLDRFSENPRKQFTPKSDLLSFGAGEHHCTGSLLALVEMTEIVNALLDRYSTISIGGNSVPPDTGYILRSAATLPIVGYRDIS